MFRYSECIALYCYSEVGYTGYNALHVQHITGVNEMQEGYPHPDISPEQSAMVIYIHSHGERTVVRENDRS